MADVESVKKDHREHSSMRLPAGATHPFVGPIAKAIFFSEGPRTSLQPLLTKFTQSGGMTLTDLAIVNMTNSFCSVLSTFPIALLGEKYGRKPMLLKGLQVSLLAMAILSVFFEFPTIMIASILLGSVSNVPRVIARLILGDICNPTNVGLSNAKFTISTNLGVVFGMMVAGMIATKISFGAAMFSQAVLAALGYLFTSKYVPETANKLRAEIPDLKQLWDECHLALTKPVVWSLVATFGPSVVSQGMMFQGLVVQCTDFCPSYLESSHYALLLTGIMLSPLPVAGGVGRACDKFGEDPVILISNAGVMIFAVIFGYCTTPGWIVGTLIITGSFWFAACMAVNTKLQNVSTSSALPHVICISILLMDLSKVAGIFIVQTGHTLMGVRAAYVFQGSLVLLQLCYMIFSAESVSNATQANHDHGKETSRPNILPFVHRQRYFITGGLAGVLMILFVIAATAPAGVKIELPDASESVEFSLKYPLPKYTEMKAILEGPGAIRAGDKYRAARANCEWKTYPARERLDKFCYGHWADKHEWLSKPEEHTVTLIPFWYNFEHCMTTGEGIQVMECDTPDVDTPEDIWKIQRVGPLYGSAGYDWHQYLWDDVWHLQSEYKPTLAEGEDIFVNAFSLSMTDKNGTFLGSPPIHNHHTHVMYWPEALREAFEEHGDSVCAEENGGTDCYLKTLPHGNAWKMDSKLAVFGDLNDVRVKGSDPLEFYIEATVRVTRKQDLNQLVNLALVQRGDPNSFALTWPLPPEPVMIWGAIMAPWTMDVIWASQHAHMKRCDELWLIKGRPEDFGLNQGAYKLDMLNPWKPFNPTQHDMTTDQIKAYLEEQLTDNPKAQRVQRVQCGKLGVQEIGELGKWDRRAPTEFLNEQGWRVEKGEIITSVSFSSRGPQKYYPMHSIWRLLGVMTDIPMSVRKQAYAYPMLPKVVCKDTEKCVDVMYGSAAYCKLSMAHMSQCVGQAYTYLSSTTGKNFLKQRFDKMTQPFTGKAKYQY